MVEHAVTVSNHKFSKEWTVKGEEENKELYDKFMKQDMMPPRNVALMYWFSTFGFRKGEEKELLTDICTSSLSHISNRLIDIHGDNRTTEHAQHVLQRISEAFFINPRIAEKGAELTMHALKVLSRTYSSANEVNSDRFLFRGVASPNFIVVEHTGASALPGQLKIVLTSDPRGLALACAMQDKMKLLPANISDLPQALRVNQKGVADNFQAMSYIRDAFMACNVAIFLREGGRFTQLHECGCN